MGDDIEEIGDAAMVGIVALLLLVPLALAGLTLAFVWWW
jgi:hypothetical protein